MNVRLLSELWRDHQGLCAAGLGVLALALAWLQILRDYDRGRREAPQRWYTGYSPPPFLLPNRWSLKDLNTNFKRSSTEKADSASDG